MNRIDELLEHKRQEIESRKRSASFSIPPDDRRVDWNKHGFRIVAEIKRASLSAGNIRSDLTPAFLARAYESAGASAVSVLTEQNYFKGSLADLTEVHEAVKIPVLQKDFILDEFQIGEAKAAGADFVLLIARFLSSEKLNALQAYCEEIRMNVIVEITSEADLQLLRNTPRFLGVNSRDLQTLEVDVRKFARLRSKLPNSFLIAESGINQLEILREIQDLGYHAALIGEHFLRAGDPKIEAQRFIESAASHQRSSKTRVKICGITNETDAIAAMEAGADALGFIFADSPRRIDTARLAAIRSKIPDRIACVGVFRGQTKQEVEGVMNRFALDIAQVYDGIEVPGVVWHAKSDFSFDERNTIIWDLKAERDSLPQLWRQLSTRAGNVFALAGGLDPENVNEAISICRPIWVDVARGVEMEPGKKDHNKLHAFMRAAKDER